MRWCADDNVEKDSHSDSNDATAACMLGLQRHVGSIAMEEQGRCRSLGFRAPKVRRPKVWQLYHQDANGGADEALIEEVAFDLYQRCESILMVTDNNRVPCPSCHTIIVAPGARWSRATPIVCPDCGWHATYGQLRDSRRHRDLHGGNAMDAFRAYVDGYPRHTSPRERMLAIDP